MKRIQRQNSQRGQSLIPGSKQLGNDVKSEEEKAKESNSPKSTIQGTFERRKMVEQPDNSTELGTLESFGSNSVTGNSRFDSDEVYAKTFDEECIKRRQ